jgi:serine/threonine-protein kinase
MAEVQLALQRGPAGFEKLVVVKLVHGHLATQKTFVDMLLEEARMAALVKHPNVVDIYDLGEAEGRYFIAMEYLEGEPLLAVLRAGREGQRLDVMSTARLIADTAEGLEAAHELRTLAGEHIELVHHDVSLGNIVALYNGMVKLVDFGVAKATQSAGKQMRVQGKFSYMAPEKLQGFAGDRRSDIWSLGCVLWEALTLRRLFKGGNDEDTMRQVLEVRIALPSQVNPEVPTIFDAIVMKALARDPKDRYATAKEMAVALEDVLTEHKYGGKNDIIAKYMQSTFASHIDARKKLLQEVASKGRASADVLEAAFDDPLTQGTPGTATPAGDFSVKFVQSGEIPLPRRDNSPPPQSPQARRVARASGQYLSQPTTDPSQPLAAVPQVRERTPSAPPAFYERPLTGGGTSSHTGMRAQTKKRLLLGGVAAAVLLLVVLVVARGGDAPPKKPVVAASTVGMIPPKPPTSPPTQPAVAVDAAVAVVEIDAAEAVPTETPIEPGSDAPTTHVAKTPTTAAITKAAADALFKTGMQQYVRGDVKPSVATFRKALQADPNYGPAWRALGLANEKLGEWGQAKTAFQKYLQVAPNAADAGQIRDRIKNL